MTEQTPDQEQTFFTIGNKKVPPNHKFEYRGIMHIGDPLKMTYEELVEQTVQKFKNLDAGLNADGTPKRGTVPEPVEYGKGQYRDLKAKPKDLGPQDADLKEEFRDDPVALENAELKKQLAAMQEQIDAISKGKDEEPEEIKVEAETPKTIGKGICSTCQKEFKRLDMHIEGGKTCLKPRKAANG